jgi:hypothetical protein
VKTSTVLFFLLPLSFFLLLTTSLFGQGTRPIPPGIHEAQRAEDQTQRNEVPPQTQKRGVDPAKLRRDAEELASLAQSIPRDVDQTTKGVLPKDLGEKLKRIEKLAKQLRGQVMQ